MKHSTKISALLSLMMAGLLAAPARADESGLFKESNILDLLLKQTGVYDKSKAGKSPDFVVDPAWPRPLPHNWLLGQIGGLYVDNHDHVWVYNRPRTLNDDEVGLEGAIEGATDAKGQPINGLGFVRANGFGADCCRAAPSVLEFDADGKLLRAWAGHPIPALSAANAEAKTVASGRMSSTAFTSTRKITSGSPAMVQRPSPGTRKFPGPPTKAAETASF
jgi:hypothetical protein